MSNSSNRVALVTGAGTGLGKAIAISLAEEGYTVGLNGRGEEKLRKLEKEINNGKTILVPGDVTDEKSVQKLRDVFLEQSGGNLDLLVNNVGGVPAKAPISEMTLKQWNQVIDKNLTSQFLVTKAFLPALRDNGSGKIISVTSGMAHFFMKEFGAYSAGKAGMESLMKVVEEEEKEHGIEVHLFDPENVISESNPEGEKDAMEVVGGVMGMIK
ncbi:MAG TPA: SDR family NAD(P)-dependent oxidoreductase [Fodinibius sp.]|nr:SDR family NAD(P)-dependent oxidoreductase [Fodinibius sp.]